MVHFVLSAFRAARFADLCTNAAQFLRELRSAAHEGRCAPARFSTVAVEADARRHFGHVAFLKAGAGAMLALLRALDTRRDATLKFVVSHCKSSLERIGIETKGNRSG
jgi:hypothetical protein